MPKGELTNHSLTKSVTLVWICTGIIYLFNILKHFVFHSSIVMFDKIIIVVVTLCAIIITIAKLRFKE